MYICVKVKFTYSFILKAFPQCLCFNISLLALSQIIQAECSCFVLISRLASFVTSFLRKECTDLPVILAVKNQLHVKQFWQVKNSFLFTNIASKIETKQSDIISLKWKLFSLHTFSYFCKFAIYVKLSTDNYT